MTSWRLTSTGEKADLMTTKLSLIPSSPYWLSYSLSFALWYRQGAASRCSHPDGTMNLSEFSAYCSMIPDEWYPHPSLYQGSSSMLILVETIYERPFGYDLVRSTVSIVLLWSPHEVLDQLPDHPPQCTASLPINSPIQDAFQYAVLWVLTN